MRGWQALIIKTLICAGLVVAWLGGSFFLIDKWQPANTVNLGPLDEGHEVEQEIFAPEDGLARVDLHLDNNSPDAGSEIEFELTGTPGRPGPSPLRTVEISPDEVNSFEMHRFEFDEVEDSGGREFVIRLSSDERRGGGLTLRASGEDVYRDGGLFIDGKEAAGDLNFAIYHEAAIGGLADKVEPFRPPLLDQNWFFIGCMAVAAIVFGWLLTVLAGGYALSADDVWE